MANTAPSKSGICVGTVSKGKIILIMRFNELFNESNYVCAGLTTSPIESGTSTAPSGKVIELPTSLYATDDYYLIIGANFAESTDEYKLYAYTQNSVGVYNEVDEGSPISFFSTKYTIETSELGGGRFRLAIHDLEQTFSKENYNSLIVTKEELEEGTSELPSWYFLHAPKNSTSTKTFVEILSSSFSAGTYYVYKETKFGTHYFIGKATFESSQEPDVEISDCKIEYSVLDRKEFLSDDGLNMAYVDNCVDITGEAWSRFCDAINVVREDVGLSEATFTSGDTLSAIMWNEAMEAFADAAEAAFCSFDTEKFTASRGMPITEELIDSVNADISAVLDEIT